MIIMDFGGGPFEDEIVRVGDWGHWMEQLDFILIGGFGYGRDNLKWDDHVLIRA